MDGKQVNRVEWICLFDEDYLSDDNEDLEFTEKEHTPNLSLSLGIYFLKKFLS